jgi:hypothetical protein
MQRELTLFRAQRAILVGGWGQWDGWDAWMVCEQLRLVAGWGLAFDGYMITNELRSPFTGRPYNEPGFQSHSQWQPRQPVQEDTLKMGQIQIERKTFNLTLKENSRGRFLRISEENNTKRNAVIIPATGLMDFQKLVDEMVKESGKIPGKSELAATK